MRTSTLLLSVIIIMLFSLSCSNKPDYKKVTSEFIAGTSSLQNYTIREVADTTSPQWKAVIVYAKQGAANTPILFLVSSDGKSVIPNSMVYVDKKPVFARTLEPELGKVEFKLTDKDRIVYNPVGTKTVFMFFDPDCPFCKKARENLKNYNGEYRVVVKFFPLEQIHPGATQKAINEQAEWLKKNRKDLANGVDITKEAKKMVEEDILEAQKAGMSGVPTYVMEDGTIKQGLF